LAELVLDPRDDVAGGRRVDDETGDPLLAAPRSVTANTTATSACLPVVMNCLTPLST